MLPGSWGYLMGGAMSPLNKNKALISWSFYLESMYRPGMEALNDNSMGMVSPTWKRLVPFVNRIVRETPLSRCPNKGMARISRLRIMRKVSHYRPPFLSVQAYSLFSALDVTSRQMSCKKLSPEQTALRAGIERGFERSFAGLEDFKSAAPVGAAWKFQEDRVAAGRNLQSGRCIAVKFFVDKDFGAVRIRGNGNCTNSIGSRRRSRG